MITPNKRTNKDNSIIFLTGEVLTILKKSKNGRVKINQLVNKTGKIKKINRLDELVPALNFLFLLGKIEYNSNTDEVELKQDDIK